MNKMKLVTLALAGLLIVACSQEETKKKKGDGAVNDDGTCTQAIIDLVNNINGIGPDKNITDEGIVKNCDALTRGLGFDRTCKAMKMSTAADVEIGYKDVKTECESAKQRISLKNQPTPTPTPTKPTEAPVCQFLGGGEYVGSSYYYNVGYNNVAVTRTDSLDDALVAWDNYVKNGVCKTVAVNCATEKSGTFGPGSYARTYNFVIKIDGRTAFGSNDADETMLAVMKLINHGICK